MLKTCGDRSDAARSSRDALMVDAMPFALDGVSQRAARLRSGRGLCNNPSHRVYVKTVILPVGSTGPCWVRRTRRKSLLAFAIMWRMIDVDTGLSSFPSTPRHSRNVEQPLQRDWLCGSPTCRSEGSTVHVTLPLGPAALSRPACLAWSAGPLHATTPRIRDTSVTCSIPRGVFEYGGRVTLQILAYGSSDHVRAWTQIPVLQESVFRASMSAGEPILAPTVALAGRSLGPEEGRIATA